MPSAFNYLIRFIDERGRIVFGDLHEFKDPQDVVGTEVSVLAGDSFVTLKRTDQSAIVRKILSPLSEIPAIHCIGANYYSHTEEASFTPPSQPVVFQKPVDCVTGPYDKIHCHPDSQTELDYEGELCFIFSRDCKDVDESSAMDHILGYTVGNDVTARNLISMQVSGFQMGYAKSFDSFAPCGPYLAAAAIIEDPHELRLRTWVNGELRQDESTSGMIWSIPSIVTHLTRGRTVRAGTVVMTGTPAGVGWFMNPKGYMKAGDTVQVSVEKLGTIQNVIVYD